MTFLKRVIGPAVLIVLGLWAAISLTMFLWHVQAGQRIRRATTKFEQVGSSSTKILLAGDSVVFGVGAHRPESSIAGLFGRDFPSASVTNVGVSGAETDGLVQQLESVHGQRFSLVVMIIGANDVVHLAGLSTSLKHFDQALVLARELSDQVLVMPEGNMGNAPIFPRLAAVILTPRSRTFRTGAIAAAKRHRAAYVDVFFERHDDAWRSRPSYFYAGDYFHPTDPGYLDWYHALREGMSRAGWRLSR